MLELDAVILKATGPVLTAVGSIILAVRIEAIIDAVLLGIDANMKALFKLIGKDAAGDLEKSHQQVLLELRRGKNFLWWGFAVIALGGMVNALSYFIN